MLYLVSDSRIDKNVRLCKYEDDICFVVNADNDQELINAIATAIERKCDEDDYGEMTLDDYDGSTWQVRELGENFEVELEISRKIGGKRL